MKQVWASVLLLFTLLGAAAWGHDIPRSDVALRLGNSGLTAELRLPWTGLSADIPALGPFAKKAPENGAATVSQNRDAIIGLVTSRLVLTADGRMLTHPEVGSLTLSGDRADVRLELDYPYLDDRGNALPPPQTLTTQVRLFPSDPNHKTLLRIYRGKEDGKLEREEMLTFLNAEVMHKVGGGQSAFEVVRQFVREGIHHIFIGPDHILFIIGLMLAGGTLGQILKIVTGFTLAHSITLALAALGLVAPSPRIIEPAIALSIIFVGADFLLRGRTADPQSGADHRPLLIDRRLFYAFGFGLIHGFGFASAMSELDLPRYALGWTLVSFNIGVEIGQACIVLLTLPILAALTRWNALVGGRVRIVAAIGVIAAGAYWFVERILS